MAITANISVRFRTAIARGPVSLLCCLGTGLSLAAPATLWADIQSATELQRFVSPAATPNDGFGTTIALSQDGDTLLFGVPAAPCEANATQPCGAVYVFARGDDLWRLEKKLVAPDAATGDGFGVSAVLSADGNTVLIGAPFHNCGSGAADCGAAYTFRRANGQWAPGRILTASDGRADDRFGTSLALSPAGAVALVGAPRGLCTTLANQDCGAAYAYTQTFGVWAEQQKLTPSDLAPNSGFGTSLALSDDGRTALVGAPAAACAGIPATPDCGAGYAFISNGAAWTAQQKLVAANPSPELFGSSVALSANGATALIGAPAKTCPGAALRICGAAYVFTRYIGVWSQRAELAPPSTVQGANIAFGTAVALDGAGDTAVVAAAGEVCANGVPCLAAHGFIREAGGWAERARLLPAEPLGLGFLTQFGQPLVLARDGSLALLRSQVGTTTGDAPVGAVSEFLLSEALTVSQTYAPNPGTVGESLTLTLKVRNLSRTSASTVVLRDTLPSALVFKSGSRVCKARGRQVTCRLGNLAAGAGAKATIVVTPRIPGAFPNKLLVTSPGVRTAPRTETITVAPNQSGSADLAVIKTASKQILGVGETVAFRLTVTNNGPSTAKNVVLRDVLPTGLSFVSGTGCKATGAQIACRLGKMAPTRVLRRRILVRAGSVGEIVNTAGVQGSTSDPNPENDSASATVQVYP